MRLFAAVDVGSDTRAEVRRVQESLQRQFASLRDAPRMAWVADDKAHLTLRFIGEVAEEVGARALDAMLAPFPVPPFEVEWTGTGTFPTGSRPRVVWIGVSRGNDRIAALAADVSDRLSPVVGPGESRPFRAHLTVGRVKEPGSRVDWAAALAASEPRTTRTVVDHVTLYQSRTSPKGATYTALHQTPLMA
jgi:2'-5' RNA ligase